MSQNAQISERVGVSSVHACKVLFHVESLRTAQALKRLELLSERLLVAFALIAQTVLPG
jgi:hypothetical protein